MDGLPALCIRQPWAELVLRGEKTLELRSWTTNYRGPLWVHAGKRGNLELERSFELSNLYKGGYLGSVVLEAIVPMDRRRWQTWQSEHLDFGTYQPGLYAWILSSPRRFKQPIAGAGKLNLFYPSTELQLVLNQVGSAIKIA